MNNFKAQFLDIVFDDTFKSTDNGAAELLKKLVHDYAERRECGFAETAEAMSSNPDFGRNGEAGGVIVDYQSGVRYVDASEDCTWMTLEQLVAAALQGGGVPDWWNSEWTTGKTDEELEEEGAEEAIYAEAKRKKFESFSTGVPLETIEYSYDENFMYEKCGPSIIKAEITSEQIEQLDALQFTDSIRAAYIFGDASGRGSNAPI